MGRREGNGSLSKFQLCSSLIKVLNLTPVIIQYFLLFLLALPFPLCPHLNEMYLVSRFIFIWLGLGFILVEQAVSHKNLWSTDSLGNDLGNGLGNGLGDDLGDGLDDSSGGSLDESLGDDLGSNILLPETDEFPMTGNSLDTVTAGDISDDNSHAGNLFADNFSADNPSADNLFADNPSAGNPSAANQSAANPSADDPSAENPSIENLSTTNLSADSPSAGNLYTGDLSADNLSADHLSAENFFKNLPADKAHVDNPLTDGAHADSQLPDSQLPDNHLADSQLADSFLTDYPLADGPLTNSPNADSPLAKSPLVDSVLADNVLVDDDHSCTQATGRLKARGDYCSSPSAPTKFELPNEEETARTSEEVKDYWCGKNPRKQNMNIQPVCSVELGGKAFEEWLQSYLRQFSLSPSLFSKCIHAQVVEMRLVTGLNYLTCKTDDVYCCFVWYIHMPLDVSLFAVSLLSRVPYPAI